METIPEVESEAECEEDMLRIPIHRTKSDSFDRYTIQEHKRVRMCGIHLPYGWGVVLLSIGVLCMLGFLIAMTYEYLKCLNQSRN